MKFKTFLGFAAGFGTGISLAILFAPQSGKATRKKIMEEADGLIDKAVMMGVQNASVDDYLEKRNRREKQEVISID